MTPTVPAPRIAAAAGQLNPIALTQAAAAGAAAAALFSTESAATIQGKIAASVRAATGTASGDHLAALGVVATAAALAAAKPSAARRQLAAKVQTKIKAILAEVTKNKALAGNRNVKAFTGLIRG